MVTNLCRPLIISKPPSDGPADGRSRRIADEKEKWSSYAKKGRASVRREHRATRDACHHDGQIADCRADQGTRAAARHKAEHLTAIGLEAGGEAERKGEYPARQCKGELEPAEHCEREKR